MEPTARHDHSPDVVGVGEAMLELRALGPLATADRLHVSSAGDVLNALVALARLGTSTGFVSRVGDDPFGARLREAWRDLGVDVRHAPLVQGKNGVYFISLSRDGEREFVYHRRDSAASRLAPHDIDQTYVSSARIVLVSGITQAVSESAQAATAEVVRVARASGTVVAYDPNYRRALWRDRAERAFGAGDPEELETAALVLARQAFLEIASSVDVMMPSFPSDAILVAPEPTSPAELATAVAAFGAATVGVKAGATGAYVARGHEVSFAPGKPVAAPKDTTGAGDAWNGAFLHMLLRGWPALDAAAFANRYGAWSVHRSGAIPRDVRGMPRPPTATS
jgi:2-dehydro-3-deoxygluconokinase